MIIAEFSNAGKDIACAKGTFPWPSTRQVRNPSPDAPEVVDKALIN